MTRRTTLSPFYGAVPEKWDQTWLSNLLKKLDARMNNYAGALNAQPQILLSSPDGNYWVLTVNNAGVLSATAFDRTTAPPPAL